MTRAFAITGKGEPPAVTDLQAAEPGDHQARIAVRAGSLNGMDSHVAAGYVWDVMPHAFPVILGRDFAGIVDAVGAGVTGFEVGDRVARAVTGLDLHLGALAEQVVVDADSLTRIPDGVSFEQAAAIGLAGVMARDLVDTLELSAEDVVLVSGATGGVGSLVVQLAAAQGATVVATATDDRSRFVEGLGADHVVDYSTDLAAQVEKVAPDGLTAVVHTAGDPGRLGALLRPGGRFASSVGATSEQVGRDDVRVTGVLAVSTPEKLSSLLEAVAAGSLQVPVTGTYPLDDAGVALADFGRPKQGKLVITIA
jgi:NADPH:quinone reductase-like Zn-dependent oxidoreductase